MINFNSSLFILFYTKLATKYLQNTVFLDVFAYV
jgi:hypothetical protein